TEEGDTLSPRDRQIDPGEGCVVTVPVNQPPYFEHMFHRLPPWERSCRKTGSAGSEIDHEVGVTDVMPTRRCFGFLGFASSEASGANDRSREVAHSGAGPGGDGPDRDGD